MAAPPHRLQAELLADVRATLGEGPLWDAAHSRVLWVDIVTGRVYGTSLDGTTKEIVRVAPPLGAVALDADGSLVLLAGEGIQRCATDGSGLTEIVHVPMRAGERWNDAKVDPRGRLIAGTLTETFPGGVKTYPPLGSRLLAVGADRAIAPLLDVTLSNGLGWTVDGRTFIYADTKTSRLDRFDYSPDTGAITGRRPVASVAEQDGWPDGLAVDEEGGVWLALWGGHAVRRYLPDGHLDAVIELPVTNVTSCAFVGANLDRLFITSARDELSEEQLAAEPHAGSVFIADPGVRGAKVAVFAG